MPHIMPKCKECEEELLFWGIAKMGGRRSNHYKCPKCKKVIEIYDRDLTYYEAKEAQHYKEF